MTAVVGKTAPRLLTRPGCGLCDDFVEAFAAELPQLFAQLTIVDVDDRDDWRARYGLRIPVLLDGAGEPVCETFFDAEQVRAGLAGPGSPR